MKSFKILSILFFSFALTILAAPVFGNEIAIGLGAVTAGTSFVPMPAGVLGINNIAARMIYDNAREAIRKAFPENPQMVNIVKLTQGSLRFSQAIAAGQTQYKFPILVNETQLGIFNTEQRLNLQDSFVVSEMGIFVSAPGSAVDTAYRLRSYPNLIDFPTAGAADALNTLYNGSLSLTVNNDVLIPNWDVLRHLKLNQTQQTAALAAGSPDDQFNGQEDGFYPVEPNIVLIGSKNNVLQINLPAAFAAIQAFSRIEVVVRGVLAQNSTVIR